MGIKGIESVVYATDNIVLAKKFWIDFGLTVVSSSENELLFKTLEGSTIEVKNPNHHEMPLSPATDPTARETVFGVSDFAVIEDLKTKLEKSGFKAEIADDNTLRTIDPNGYALGFRVSSTQALEPKQTLFNNASAPQRIDKRANIFDRARPQHIAHVVYLSPKLIDALNFYQDILGFVLTDSYAHGYFLRCPDAIDHHNIFILNVENVHGFHHISFDVQDLHELFGGGLYLDKRGWETHIGPGRHPVSSAYFWYFVNPCGGAAEYDFDSDVVTDEWTPEVFPSTPEAFAEWAIPKGLEGVSYRGAQTTSVDKAEEFDA